MRKVLFVCYGGGHVQMVLPVALALRESGWAEPVVLALTTAAGPVLEAGLPLLQFKDLVEPADDLALSWGEKLLARMDGATIDREESVAYLGLSFRELAEDLGEAEALREYEEKGRQAFLPVRVLERALRRVAPDALVSTTSPRAEHAAFLAASRMGIPSLCIVDSFLQDEAIRLGAPGYASRWCVFNEAVREVLSACGADAARIHCTGNPAFDVLQDPGVVAAGRRMRAANGWEGRTAVLVPVQRYGTWHPVAGRWEGADLPCRMEEAVRQWVLARDDAVLCVRPRPGEADAGPAPGGRIVRTASPEFPLGALLHAIDIVVTISSTVGIEGHLAGARVVQVLGTPFDASSPWLAFGIADRAVHLPGVPAALDELAAASRRRDVQARPLATPQVVRALRELFA